MRKKLNLLLLIYGVASLMHFIHNAEFLAAYPNLPDSWTRAGVYLAWAGLTTVGAVGWLLLKRGYQIAGLLAVAVYAMLGMDSLGHTMMAPMSTHTTAMNTTILFEVTAGACLFIAVLIQIVRLCQEKNSLK